LNARLHQIVCTDAQACPRCLDRDGVEIWMFLPPEDGLTTTSKTRSGWHLLSRDHGR
jgi:hypothetical protein